MYTSRDIIAAFQEMFRGTLNVSNYLAGFRQPLVFVNFALDDPLPAIAELPAVAWYRLANKLNPRSRNYCAAASTADHRFGDR
jgi:predicted ATP-grasp superfamily ATP-dependent carboligase